MKLNEFEEVCEIANEIGIYTLADLALFKKQQCANDETLLQGLKRYQKELGGNKNNEV